MMEMGMGHGMHMKPDNFVAAQAVKDATMAYFISSNLEKGSLMLHYNGDYHSRNYGGIYWYLKRSDPSIGVQTIASVESGSLKFKAEHRGLGDYVLLVAGQ
jgi:uncharacterized iron-regulated protein